MSSLWVLLALGCGGSLEGAVPGGCSNGIDDDENGSLDCADASCANAPDCAVEEDLSVPTDTGGLGTSDPTPPVDSGEPNAAGPSDPESASVVDAACNTNSMRVTLPDGMGSADFDAFVWTIDDDELVVAGLQTGGADGCAAVTNIEAQPGYLLELDLVGTPVAGDEYAIVFDANDPLQAEVRFENLGTSVAEVSIGEGSLAIVAFDTQATLQISGFTTILNGGSAIVDGTFTACPCGRIPQ